MKQYFRSSRFWVLVLVVVLFAQSLMILALFSNVHDQKNYRAQDRNRFDSELTQLKFSSPNTMNRPLGSAKENVVYFPEIKLTVPLAATSLTMLYSVRSVMSEESDTPVVVDVDSTTHAANVPLEPQRLACFPIRLAFESKSNPYNNHEKNTGSVKLADGRTLQIYALADSSCNLPSYNAQDDSAALAAIFEQAQSY